MAMHANMAYGYSEQKRYAKRASEARVAGLQNAFKEMDVAAGGLTPYRQYGTESLGRMERLFQDPSYIQNLPGYQFTLQQGLKGTEAMRSRTSIFSGETLRALTDYASGLASKTYADEWARISEGIKTGFAAEGQIGQYQTTKAEIAAGIGESQARKYDQYSAALAGEIGFGRQIFGQWSGAMAGATASKLGGAGGGMGGIK